MAIVMKSGKTLGKVDLDKNPDKKGSDEQDSENRKCLENLKDLVTISNE